jgi:stage III sporulation protein AH
MLKAQGFEDALCYLSDSSANIIVKTPGLDAAGAAKIKSTLLSEAEFTNDQITIVEVN